MTRPAFIHIASIPEHHTPQDSFQIQLGGSPMGPTLTHEDARIVADWLSEAWPRLEELL